MPDRVFQVVLPLFWLGLVLGIGGNRWRVKRRLGRDPVVVRPWREPDTPAGYLETAFSIGAVLLTADVLLNAIWPSAVADTLAIRLLRTSRVAGYLGLTLLASGFLLGATAVRQMGVSWRMGIDSEAPGSLVSRGLFARVRHPIYVAILLATSGLAAVTADLFSVAVAAGAWVGVPVQARLEETFLQSRFPQEYGAYLQQTGRFWPRAR